MERGIPSDVVDGFFNRLDYVLNLKSKICFIMGGINDIYAGLTIESIFESYIKIIETFKRYKIIPIVQSTLYVSPKWHHAAEKNLEVKRLNSLLYDYCINNKITFLDLNQYCPN